MFLLNICEIFWILCKNLYYDNTGIKTRITRRGGSLQV